jgi:TolB-like protein
MNTNTKFALVATCVVFLNGCAVSKMLMAGYTPPQTIADLLKEQELRSGEATINGQESGNGRGGISLENYKGDSSLTPLVSDANTESGRERSIEPWQTPSTLFRPSFSHKSLEDYAGQLSMQLLRNSAGMKKDDLIGVASFVRLDRSLQQTNILGNQLSEYFISEIQQFGLAVVDFKMTGAAKVTARGDFVFSRDSLELAKDMHMDHMLSGTMIDKPKGVQINARIISIENRRVVSTATVLIPHFIAQSLRPEYVSMVN